MINWAIVVIAIGGALILGYIIREEQEKNVLERLLEELLDESYYGAWQANIAMSFFDEVMRNKDKVRISRKNLHKISNRAAHNFLNSLMG